MSRDFLTEASLYVDGQSYLGKVTEMTPPKITPKFREFNAGGVSAAMDIPTGRLEKMECEFTVGTYDKALFQLLRVVPSNTVPLVMRAGLVKDDGSHGQVVLTLRGFIKEIDRGNWKPDEETTVKISMTLSYYKEEIDGETVIEADPINYRLFVNGDDQLANLASALGRQ